MAAAVTFDCASEDFDRWDVLENVTHCPFVIESSASDGFASCLPELEHALCLYPGIAAVRAADGAGPEMRALAERYGAVII